MILRRSERLLLDTHVLLWLISGEEERRLRPARSDLGAAQESGQVHVSAYSGWEIGMLVSKGRIHIDGPVDLWFDRALSRPGTRVLDVTPDIAVEAATLPGSPPADPADRMLIATARRRSLTLVTADRRILDYAAAGAVQVIDVS